MKKEPNTVFFGNFIDICLYFFIKTNSTQMLDAYVSINEDVIAVNERSGIKKEEIKLVGNINIS